MKRIGIIIIMFVMGLSVWASTEIEIDETIPGVDSVYMWCTDVFPAYGNNEEAYVLLIIFTPKTQIMPDTCFLQISKFDGNLTAMPFDTNNNIPWITTQTTDDVEPGMHQKMIIPNVGHDNTFATISCEEDYAYFLSLLRRNRGTSQLHFRTSNTQTFIAMLDYDPLELAEKLEECELHNITAQEF